MNCRVKVTATRKCVVGDYVKEMGTTSYLGSKEEFLKRMQQEAETLSKLGYTISHSDDKEVWTCTFANRLLSNVYKFIMTIK